MNNENDTLTDVVEEAGLIASTTFASLILFSLAVACCWYTAAAVAKKLRPSPRRDSQTVDVNRRIL